MSGQERQPTQGQLAKDLPGLTAYLTGHAAGTGHTTIVERRPAVWKSVDNGGMAFNVPFTNTANPQMNGNVDIAEHDKRLASGKLGIVNPSGTVLRFVDFAPGKLSSFAPSI